MYVRTHMHAHTPLPQGWLNPWSLLYSISQPVSKDICGVGAPAWMSMAIGKENFLHGEITKGWLWYAPLVHLINTTFYEHWLPLFDNKNCLMGLEAAHMTRVPSWEAGFVVLFLRQGFSVLGVLELILKPRLASNSEIHLPLPPEYWDSKVCTTTNQLLRSWLLNGLPKLHKS